MCVQDGGSHSPTRISLEGAGTFAMIRPATILRFLLVGFGACALAIVWSRAQLEARKRAGALGPDGQRAGRQRHANGDQDRGARNSARRQDRRTGHNDVVKPVTQTVAPVTTGREHASSPNRRSGHERGGTRRRASHQRRHANRCAGREPVAPGAGHVRSHPSSQPAGRGASHADRHDRRHRSSTVWLPYPH